MIIFHIDVNSAYLSWTAVEQLKNGARTDIRTIPAIIGGDQKSRHGIVLAKSVPAKKYGIRTGEPVANAFRKCPNLHMEAPDHEMYHKHSRELMAFLRSYTPDIEHHAAGPLAAVRLCADGAQVAAYAHQCAGQAPGFGGAADHLHCVALAHTAHVQRHLRVGQIDRFGLLVNDKVVDIAVLGSGLQLLLPDNYIYQ